MQASDPVCEDTGDAASVGPADHLHPPSDSLARGMVGLRQRGNTFVYILFFYLTITLLAHFTS